MLDRVFLLREAKELFVLPHSHDLEEVLSKSNVPEKYLGALLFAYGFPYVDFRRDDNKLIFLAGYELNNLETQIIYNTSSKHLSGKMNSSIKKVFQLVDIIENSIDSMLLLSPVIRKSRIDEILNDLEIDKNLFKMILRNWS